MRSRIISWRKVVAEIILTELLVGLLVVALSIQFSSAKPREPPAIEWIKTYSETRNGYAESVVQTSDGGYAIVGYTNSSGAGKYDAYLMKTDSNGNTQWNKTYGGEHDDRAYSVIQTSDGGYAITGAYDASWGDRGFWGSGMWLIKTDEQGNMQWNRTYAPPEWDDGGEGASACSLVQTVDGGYAVAGCRAFWDYDEWEGFWLVKTDSSGIPEWNQTYVDGIAESMVQTTDGGYAMTGRSYVDKWGNPGPTGSGFLLVKADANGSMQWSRTYNYERDARALAQTTDEGYAVAGVVGRDNSWLIKTDADGNPQWNKTCDGLAWSLALTPDGGYAMSGANQLFKTNSSGSQLWSLTLEATITSMGVTPDGGYVLAGYKLATPSTQPSYEVHEFWLAKVGVESGRWTPVPVFSYSPNAPIVNESITFNASAGYDPDGTVINYNWDFGDGNAFNETSPVATHKYSTPGSYNVTLVVVDNDGLNDTTSAVVVIAKIPAFVSVSTNCPSAFVGFKVNVTGTLSDVYGCLSGDTVVLYYTFSGIDTWTPITSDVTDELGNYSIMWIPTATGYFTLKAEWAGDSTHFGTNNTLTFSSLTYENRYVFAVESNSTISNLAFDSQNRRLNFTATGPDGTIGCTKVTVAKSLLANIEDLKISIDGIPYNCAVSDLDDSWALRFVYTHSSHEIGIDLGYLVTPPNVTLVSPQNRSYNSTFVSLTFTVNENTSWIGYSLDSEANVTIAGNTTLTISEGSHSIVVYANDTSGNMGSSDTISFVVDTTSPITTDDYDTAWHATDFQITLASVDNGSGISGTYYQINSNPIQNLSINGQPHVTTEGANNTLEYWSVDKAGNEEEHHFLANIALDKTPPTIVTPLRDPSGDVQPDQPVRISVNVSDSLSGVDSVRLVYFTNRSSIGLEFPMMLNQTSGLYERMILVQEASTLVKYQITAHDRAGNNNTNDNAGEYYVYTVIPEFPSFLIIPLFTIVTLLTALTCKRKYKI